MAELPSGTVTLLFTDIESSTRLLERLGAGYLEVLGEHRRLLRAAFAQFDGHEVGTEGDSFFVAFARASDAVAAAAQGQRALVAHRWPDGVVLRVRMGMHTGEPIVGAGDYAGWRCIGRRGSARLDMGGRSCAPRRPGSCWGPSCPPGWGYESSVSIA
jgi:class 3 adenylate cyclase